MTRTNNFNRWQDRVAGVDEPLGRGADWSSAAFKDAVSFARLTIECAVQPVMALLEELPELLHFEMHTKCESTPRRDR